MTVKITPRSSEAVILSGSKVQLLGKGPRGARGLPGIDGIDGTDGDPGPSGVIGANAPLVYDPVTKLLSLDRGIKSNQALAGHIAPGNRRRAGWFATQQGVPTALAMGSSSTFLAPWLLAEDIPFDQMSIFVNVFITSGTLRFLVYAHDPVLAGPGALLYSADITVTATGWQHVAVPNGLLPAGIVYIGGAGIGVANFQVTGNFGAMNHTAWPTLPATALYAGAFFLASTPLLNPWPSAGNVSINGCPRLLFRMT